MQITNSDSDIAFGGNVQVDIIDDCQNVVLNLAVNENIFINEFTNSVTGVKNIAFEFGNTGKDYDETLLYLRFTHTTSDKVWFSNGFFITENLKEETTRFEYKNENYYKGISYDVVPLFQSIRLTCFESDFDYNLDDEEYTPMSGNTISLRPILTPLQKFLFYSLDKFTHSRLVVMLTHDILYINSNRISNKPKATKGDRVVDTNFFECTFEANPTDELYNVGYQIYQSLEVVGLTPNNNATYRLSDIDGHFLINFNKPIGLVSGITAKLYENNILVSTITPTSSTSNLILNFSAHTFIDANYTIVIEPNKIYSTNTLIPEYFGGFAYGEWSFIIAEYVGDFDKNDFNNSDFNT